MNFYRRVGLFTDPYLLVAAKNLINPEVRIKILEEYQIIKAVVVDWRENFGRIKYTARERRRIKEQLLQKKT